MKRCVCIVFIRLSQQYLEIKHDENKITPYQFQSLCSLFGGNVKPRIFGIGFCLTDIHSDNLKPSLFANCPKTRFVCFPILHNSSLKYLWGIEGCDIELQIVQMQMSSFLRFFFFSFFVSFFRLFLFFLSFLFFFFRLSVFFFSFFFFHVCG